jgi:hypothetical protein
MAKSCRYPVTTAQIFLAACIPRRADRHQRSQRETSTSPACLPQAILIDASVNAGKPSKIGAVFGMAHPRASRVKSARLGPHTQADPNMFQMTNSATLSNIEFI